MNTVVLAVPTGTIATEIRKHVELSTPCIYQMAHADGCGVKTQKRQKGSNPLPSHPQQDRVRGIIRCPAGGRKMKRQFYNIAELGGKIKKVLVYKSLQHIPSERELWVGKCSIAWKIKQPCYAAYPTPYSPRVIFHVWEKEAEGE